MFLKKISTPGLAVHSYLLADENEHVGIVIDPTCNIEPILSCAKENMIAITGIVETHVHADFISGSYLLKTALEGKPVIHCSSMGGEKWIPKYADHLLKDRDTLYVGKLRVEVWHTPGHTQEHIILVVYDERRNSILPEIAFTGDLLFVGSIGRPDLMGKELEESLVPQLYHSLFTVLQPLPDFVEIFPSHGTGSLCGKGIGMQDSSTLGYERRCNPWLMAQEFQSWRLNAMKDLPTAPSYFKRVKVWNTQFPEENAMPSIVKLSSEEIHRLYPTDLIVDVRSVEDFAAGHLKNSINVPMKNFFPSWAGMTIPDEGDFILVVKKIADAEAAIRDLKLVKLDKIRGFILDSDIPRSQMVPLPTINAQELKTRLNEFILLDVRTPVEWIAGHLDGACHIELSNVNKAVSELPKEKSIAVLCQSGTRASIVASILVRNGFSNVVNVKGGMMAIIPK